MGFSTQSAFPAPNPNEKFHFAIQAKSMILVSPPNQALKEQLDKVNNDIYLLKEDIKIMKGLKMPSSD